MATYEYACGDCDARFEIARPIGATVDTVVMCPSCRSERVRRRFSLFATTSDTAGGPSPGCACGGACACGDH